MTQNQFTLVTLLTTGTTTTQSWACWREEGEPHQDEDTYGNAHLSTHESSSKDNQWLRQEFQRPQPAWRKVSIAIDGAECENMTSPGHAPDNEVCHRCEFGHIRLLLCTREGALSRMVMQGRTSDEAAGIREATCTSESIFPSDRRCGALHVRSHHS